MSDTLIRALDLIEPGDLVIYHGSLTHLHGLWLAVPCNCGICHRLDLLGFAEIRFALVDPWGERSGPHHARRESITRSAACG
ncbi:hypothetical protein SCAB_60821 [Streptomyces scabiei 87.22]|uniref:Uncharacterized protein n=1 Tax=Streptomyces scabiei (strain 87.22) TaxID=680198 RepID=C9Z912_STRSW|nr:MULTISPECIES: hypothetical protein [Streptomyces]MBP5875691.1 hypothetical protein [Streptomyces sp. LBUM 1477]MDX2652148.1 hypothetical protein [Streptomyces scabiei]MDX2725826.1 hypothetical protein [Streptomyces scabiei]MDX2749615.1 hypothetical protein [Streptomyces scabiei]MDX2863945.1 hypothetical protein [Streptomyces scabiei]